MPFIQRSIASRIAKSVSLITVTVQVSNVRSPAIFNWRPRKGTEITFTVDAGSAAALHIKEVSSASPRAYAGKFIFTLKRLGRAPPPFSLDLKSSTPKIAMVYSLCAYRANYLFEVYTSSNSNKVQLNKVDRTCRFHKDICHELVIVNHLLVIVCFVTNNTEVGDTSSTLNSTEERFYNVNKL